MTEETIAIDELARELNIGLPQLQQFCAKNQIAIASDESVNHRVIEQAATTTVIRNFKIEYGEYWMQAFQAYIGKGLLPVLIKNAILKMASRT